jgi:hypothetical protein
LTVLRVSAGATVEPPAQHHCIAVAADLVEQHDYVAEREKGGHLVAEVLEASQDVDVRGYEFARREHGNVKPDWPHPARNLHR